MKKFHPKGSMCLSCKNASSDCSKLNFEDMIKISKPCPEEYVEVKCSSYDKEEESVGSSVVVVKKPATKKDYMDLMSIAFDVNESEDNIHVSAVFCRSIEGNFISISIFDSGSGILIQPPYLGSLETNITADQAINLLSSFLPEAK